MEMPARKPRYFRVIYYDRDKCTCNISGITCDDTAVTARTCQLQQQGRNVNISTTDPETDKSRVPSAESLLRQLPDGYTHDPELSW
jgi:hypothetical protein